MVRETILVFIRKEFVNQEPIFQTSYLGFKVAVYSDRLVYRELWQKNTIPIQQIASVDLGMPFYGQIIIETAGGKKFKIPVKNSAKKKIDEAINQAKSQIGQPVKQNDLGDLEKLNELKENGIITEEEFRAKKKQILGI